MLNLNFKCILFFLFYLLLFIGVTYGQAAPTPICMPCLATVSLSGVTIGEVETVCNDNDGLPDSGEIFFLEVSGRSRNACCTGPASVDFSITPISTHIKYIGKEGPTFGRYYYYVLSSAGCMEEINFQIDVYLTDSYPDPQHSEAHMIFSSILNADADGNGGYICDATDCENTPLLTSLLLEAEDSIDSSGITISDFYVENITSGSWLKFADVPLGPRIDKRWYIEQMTIAYACNPGIIPGKIELHLDSPQGTLLCGGPMNGGADISIFAALRYDFKYTEDLILDNDVRDLFLVFSEISTPLRLDWLQLGTLETPLASTFPVPPPPVRIGNKPPNRIFNLKLLNTIHTDEYYTHICVQGDYAYFLTNSRLPELGEREHSMVIYDRSDKKAPILLGRMSLGKSANHDLIIEGNYAYLISYYDGIKILDISNKTAPVLLSSIPDNNKAFQFAYQDNFIYAPDGYNGLSIFNVSDRTQPVLAAKFEATQEVHNVAIAGNYAYMLERNGVNSGKAVSLRVLDISDKNNPIRVGIARGDSYPVDIFIEGQYAYILDNPNYPQAGFRIYDISNPRLPQELVHTNGLVGALDHSFVSGNLFFTGQQTLNIIDVSNKGKPLSLYRGYNYVSDIFYEDGLVYLLAEKGDFIILEVEDKTPSPSPPMPPNGIIGDVNNDGNVNIIDALLIALYYVGNPHPDIEYILSQADVNNDGAVDIIDSLLIAQYYVGVIPKLPV